MSEIKRKMGWHWVDGDPNGNLVLRYSSKRFKVGDKLVHDELREGYIGLCDRGFHASEKFVDAVGYAPSNVVTRVLSTGKIITGSDKYVSTERQAIWAIDVGDILRDRRHGFAVLAAREDAEGWDTCPDSVRRYVDSNGADVKLRSACFSCLRRIVKDTYHDNYSWAQSVLNALENFPEYVGDLRSIQYGFLENLVKAEAILLGYKI